jgi:hypothetical protein
MEPEMTSHFTTDNLSGKTDRGPGRETAAAREKQPFRDPRTGGAIGGQRRFFGRYRALSAVKRPVVGYSRRLVGSVKPWIYRRILKSTVLETANARRVIGSHGYQS